LPETTQKAQNDAPSNTTGCTMPTKHRRITISLPPDLDAALVELSEVDKRPQATIVTEFLTEMVPSMHAMSKIAKQLKAGKQAEAKRTLQHWMGDGMAEILAEQSELFNAKKGKK
jgi:predicted transcriptional regulator